MGWSKTGWLSDDGWFKPAATGYSGPVNAVAGATHYWGLRAVTSASIGANCIELRRDSDNTTQTFVTITGGGLDLSAIASFKGAANLFARTLYDQIGTDHFLQTTNADQPEFNLNVANGGTLPVLSGGTAGRYLQMTLAGGAISQPFTLCAVARRTTGTASALIMGGGTTGLYFDNVSGRITTTSGTPQSVNSVTENQFHSISAVYNGASSDLNIDASTNSISPGSGTVGATIGYLAWAGQGSGANAEMLEHIIYPSALSSGSMTTLSANQHSYWGY